MHTQHSVDASTFAHYSLDITLGKTESQRGKGVGCSLVSNTKNWVGPCGITLKYWVRPGDKAGGT